MKPHKYSCSALNQVIKNMLAKGYSKPRIVALLGEVAPMVNVGRVLRICQRDAPGFERMI